MEVASNFQTLSFGPRISRTHSANINLISYKWRNLCCLDYSKMPMGVCWILRKWCIFGGSYTGAATFLESPSIIGRNNTKMGRIEFRGYIASAYSNINGLQTDHRLPSLFQMQFNAVSTGRIKIGSRYFPGHGAFDSRSGTFTPFRQGPHSHSLRPCRVMSEDSEGTLSGDNVLLNEESLAQDLKTAIKEENYARAAKIRDSLRLLQEDSKASVLAANARFYNSFRHGNLAAMQTLWSKGENVCVVHPGVSGITGYDLVMGSWEFVWAEYDFPLDIEIRDVQVHVRGDIGYVTCIEMVKTKGSSWGKQFATNVFEKVDGQWCMCVHHASYIDL